MSERYHQGRVADRWQSAWDESGVYELDSETTDPEYVLGMFPYTSGELHMGHVRNYSITDAYARFRRMQGASVLHPMGWDAFGLPAENAAHERDVDPRSWTVDCIERMREELRQIGLGYDWSREFATCDAEYYRWNQWLFARLYEAGLVEYTEARVNWCPDCETVLADAQVETAGQEDDGRPATPHGERAVADGVCWRCGTGVTARSLPQWFFTITDYAEELAEGLDELTGWPDSVREIQRHWIGQQKGAEVTFDLVDGGTVRVFSARVDTVYGVTYVALSPSHPLAAADVPADPATDDRWWGVETERVAIHPLTGDELPVYVAGYVMDEVGTGAVMGVPAHDERDHAFARAHDLPIVRAIEGNEGDETVPYTDDGVLVESGPYTGRSSDDARTALLQESGIEPSRTYRLRDWLISRQRYWGTPIPIVHCSDCGPVLVPDSELPIELPAFQWVRGNPLEADEEFVETSCPECGEPARRETDTMDTFVDSSWYFLRFLSPGYEEGPFDPDAIADGLPVDLYVGGEEHAVLHLLYLRFVSHALADLEYIPMSEPIDRLLTQGTVLHGGHKMSKSVGNVVSPHEYGPETTRLFLLSAAHPRQDFEWTATEITRAYDFQQDVYDLVTGFGPETGTREESWPKDRYLEREIDRTIEAITREYESFRFHRAIAEIEGFVGLLRRYREYGTPNRYTYERGLRTLSRLVAPITPFLAEELWSHLEGRGLIAATHWPEPLRARPDFARERALIDRVRDDVREIIEVAGIDEPLRVALTVAAEWKYVAHELGRDASTEGELRKRAEAEGILGGESSREQFVNDLRGRIAELEPVLSPDRELTILKRASWLLEDEFEVDVTVDREPDLADSDPDAAPGRPGIEID